MSLIAKHAKYILNVFIHEYSRFSNSSILNVQFPE